MLSAVRAAISLSPSAVRTAVLQNTAFRRVLRTHNDTQMVAMNVTDVIGWEVHKHVSQLFVVMAGTGMYVGGASHERETVRERIGPGSTWLVEPGTYHNVINDSAGVPLKLLTVYVPPQHSPNQVDATRELASHRARQHTVLP